MNDQELADKVVALGVVEEIDGGFYLCSDHPKQFICDAGPLRVYDFSLVTDWRVAGALMEKMTAASMLRVFGPMAARERPKPRAIIEACVEALS